MIPVSFSLFLHFSLFSLLLLLFYVIIYFYKKFIIIVILFIYFFLKIILFFHVPGCSGMFRNVPECSGMFHVPGFIDGQFLTTGVPTLLSSAVSCLSISIAGLSTRTGNSQTVDLESMIA